MAIKELDNLDSLLELESSIIDVQQVEFAELVNKLCQTLEYHQKPKKLKISDEIVPNLIFNIITFKDHKETLENFRGWYETQRHIPGGYHKQIKKITFSWKLYVLAVYDFAYKSDPDLRWLNFCLKLIDDIVNEIDIRNTSNALLPLFKAILISTIEQIRNLYEEL